MTAARERRLLKELNDIKKDDDSGISVSVPDESNLSKMVGYIIGPPDTPYQGGKFSLDITIPANYPFSPPEMYFKTKIWHPNVSSQTVSPGSSLIPLITDRWHAKLPSQ